MDPVSSNPSVGSSPPTSPTSLGSPTFVSPTAAPYVATAVDPAVLDLFERHVDFMTFLFQHVTACPPHGPFRYYSALAFVERARHRYGAAPQVTSTTTLPVAVPPLVSRASPSPAMGRAPLGGGWAGAGSLPRLPPAGRAAAPEALVKAITVENVLALMERKFNTNHLSSWPLLYVPAEIHASDVDAVVAREKERRGGSGGAPHSSST